ncbi:MAG: type I glutamate--ammonia ligase [Clostridiales bacterium]|nr:type I glutamate--ammonia ligase [Clostridiales bacterium]
MFKNFHDLQQYCKDQEIKTVDFKMIDLPGRWRHLSIPIERFSEKTLEQGIGFDASNYGFAMVEKSDMVFIPDLATAMLDPFSEIKTLSLIGDVFVIGDTHRRFAQDPRSIAVKAEEYMRHLGIADEMRIGPEFEFYLFDSASYDTRPHASHLTIDAKQAVWNSGQMPSLAYKVPQKGGYHIAPPMDIDYDLRNKMSYLLQERGVRVKYHHPEVGGPGQQEIELESGPMREIADHTMLVKYIVKNAAFKAGKTATFLPKPLWGEAGSGMHVHIQLFKEGKPLFFDPAGYSGLSQTALYFIGGLLRHVPALCALVNPSTNSYKRLVPGYEAPVNICYATANRSAVIRVPDYARGASAKRFEIRNPDASGNPYLTYAAILMAGLDGIKNKIDPCQAGFGPYDINLYQLSDEEKAKIKSLPESLKEAVLALEQDHEFLLAGDVFPLQLLQTWMQRKSNEVREINIFPTPAEFAFYYDI